MGSPEVPRGPGGGAYCGTACGAIPTGLTGAAAGGCAAASAACSPVIPLAAQSGHLSYDGGTSRPHVGQIQVNIQSLYFHATAATVGECNSQPMAPPAPSGRVLRIPKAGRQLANGNPGGPHHFHHHGVHRL